MLFNQTRLYVKVYKMNYLYVKPHVTLAFFIDDQVFEFLYSQLPKNQRSYLRDGVVSVYSSVERIWKKYHFDFSIKYEIEPNILNIFDLFSRLMDHSTTEWLVEMGRVFSIRHIFIQCMIDIAEWYKYRY